MLTAWGDESGSQPDRDPGTYIVAAALIEEEDVEAVRKTMHDLLLPTETKVHWHGSSPERRQKLVEVVLGLPVCSVIVVHNDPAANERRRRRKCLEHLFPQLTHMSCGEVTFESRGTMDASDLDILQKFRARKLAPAGMRLHHMKGRIEPVLSVADVVCGALVQARVGNPVYLQQLGGLVDIHQI
ncbi:hypothetical protein [Nocardia nova]|uniref:hypothetical protein n=1 Tax=Nocardia nova TaxID=37330 RepID=UPI0007A3807A|nr:hypothetical protein [Nocardia nova]